MSFREHNLIVPTEFKFVFPCPFLIEVIPFYLTCKTMQIVKRKKERREKEKQKNHIQSQKNNLVRGHAFMTSEENV